MITLADQQKEGEIMRTSRVWVIAACFLVVTLGLIFNPACAICEDCTNPTVIEIDVAPNVLNIGSQGEVVTVHTDIPFSSVIGAKVTLNDIPIAWWKADNHGYFVAKFSMQDVKGLVARLVEDGQLDLPGKIALTLTGFTSSDECFTGYQDDIMVIDVDPKER